MTDVVYQFSLKIGYAAAIPLNAEFHAKNHYIRTYHSRKLIMFE